MEQVRTFSGNNLRQLRQRRGWTQAELARRANVRERQIIRWENEQNAPRFEAMVALATALGCHVDEMCVNGDDDEEPRAVGMDMLEVLYAQLGAVLGEKVA